MSVMAWLFGLGALSIAFPFLFHLIRRTPRGQVEFSSLMFLKPSPPRLTRRSRLENLLLLLLRAAAIVLIAAAFMRPFLRDNAILDFSDLPGRTIAVVLDTSASMKRGDLWTQALQRVQKIAEEAGEQDQIAIYGFDSDLELIRPAGPKFPPADFLNQYQLAEVKPGWDRSDLGSALVTIADQLESDNDKNKADAKLQIVVISDMQSGSATAALQNYQWPATVMVDFEQVTLKDSTNATLELLPADEADPEALRENVIVRNSANSTTDQFTVAWSGGEALTVPFHVPPGSTRILRVPRDGASQKSERLVLNGDPADFDNQFFAVPPNQQVVTIAYLGDEPADDPEQMLYYFQRCLPETPTRVVNLTQHDSAQPFTVAAVAAPELVVVTRELTPTERDAIEACLAISATVLFVLSQESVIGSTVRWTGVSEDARFTTDSASNYAMLGEIDFGHPLFEPFAGPRFNDFTQIRFWNHLRSKASDNMEIIASFDDESPAVWHRKSVDAKGDIFVLAAGWQPSQSQLALSSKFLPIINRFVELAARTPQVTESLVIGHPVSLPAGYNRMANPDGAMIDLDPAQPVHEQIAGPGIYRFNNSADATSPEISLAVNLDPAESNTDIMPLEQITAFNVAVGRHVDAKTEIETQRKLHDVELESRQKLWKLLIVAAVGFLIAETWLAGRTDRIGAKNNRAPLEDAA